MKIGLVVRPPLPRRSLLDPARPSNADDLPAFALHPYEQHTIVSQTPCCPDPTPFIVGPVGCAQPLLALRRLFHMRARSHHRRRPLGHCCEQRSLDHPLPTLYNSCRSMYDDCSRLRALRPNASSEARRARATRASKHASALLLVRPSSSPPHPPCPPCPTRWRTPSIRRRECRSLRSSPSTWSPPSLCDLASRLL